MWRPSSVTPMSNVAAKSGLSFRVGMIETRLALPQRSPSPLSVPWIWRAPARTAGHVLDHRADDRLDLVRQRAAVGVAQHDPARAGLVSGARAGERVVGIGL